MPRVRFDNGRTELLLPGMLVHALVWNMLHPPMHGLPKVPASVGAPSAWPFRLDDRLRDAPPSRSPVPG